MSCIANLQHREKIHDAHNFSSVNLFDDGMLQHQERSDDFLCFFADLLPFLQWDFMNQSVTSQDSQAVGHLRAK